jgi:TolB-like protein
MSPCIHPFVTRARATALLFALALTAGGCASSQQTRYLHPNADLGMIKKVAVIPFENVTEDRGAGEKVTRIFFVELLALDVFDVSEPGQAVKVLRSQAASLDALGSADLQRIGKDLGVDGLFMGSVVDFSETRSGSSQDPRVTIQLRLVDAQSGTTIWSASKTRSRAALSTKLFGVGRESLTEAARDLIRDELQTLLK